jgi:hypothetical protein
MENLEQQRLIMRGNGCDDRGDLCGKQGLAVRIEHRRHIDGFVLNLIANLTRSGSKNATETASSGAVLVTRARP